MVSSSGWCQFGTFLIMSKTKICLSTQEYPPSIGGVATAAKRLARTLVAAGFSVDVVTLCNQPDRTGETTQDDEDGIRVHRLFHDLNSAEAAFAFRQLIRQLDQECEFDLFHGFFLTAVYPCVAAVKESQRQRPIIASIRGNDALTLINHTFVRASILATLRKATWVTSVNQFYLDKVSRDVDINGRCSVIRNSVEPIPETIEPWYLNQNNRGTVGTVGQLRRIKDIPLLLRGYAAISSELRNKLLLAGYFDDPEEERWTYTLANEKEVTSEIELTGKFSQNNVFSHLRRMHVYAQTSAYEGLPNALLEAACLGVPLVATAVGGMKEVIDHEENGLLVPHGDPTELTKAIERILKDDDFARYLSEGAKQLVKELSPEKEKLEWLSLYKKLL
ncbi:MAG: glycosyltransferase family 4 protein [Blastocatellia bacterium]|nr:glycosyltransferase family 4 protein [Blastocatellia bacterium]